MDLGEGARTHRIVQPSVALPEYISVPTIQRLLWGEAALSEIKSFTKPPKYELSI